MEQTRYNEILINEFDKGGYLIQIGDVLTQEVWDRLISCANFAADEYAKENVKFNTGILLIKMSDHIDSYELHSKIADVAVDHEVELL